MKRRRRGQPFVYPAEFVLFWDSISSNRDKGSKNVALQRWMAEGSPSPSVLIAKWNELLVALGDTFAPDVCTWLGNRGWEETRKPAPRNGRAPRGSVQELEDEHRRMFEEGREWAANLAKGGT